MTVTCKHGTEVYKFRCPECADEEKERSMTDTRADVATDAVRSVCDDPKIADDEFCFTKGTMKFVLTELAASEKENADLRAKVKTTQSDRELAAKIRGRNEISDPETGYTVGIEYYPDDLSDHEAAEAVAAHVAPLRAQLDEAVGLLRRFSDAWVQFVNSDRGLMSEGPLGMIAGDVRQFLVEHPLQGTAHDAKGGESE